MENALTKFRAMRMYYLAYDYDGLHELEYISGPFASYNDAENARDLLTGGLEDDPKLVIVRTWNEMEIML